MTFLQLLRKLYFDRRAQIERAEPERKEASGAVRFGGNRECRPYDCRYRPFCVLGYPVGGQARVLGAGSLVPEAAGEQEGGHGPAFL